MRRPLSVARNCLFSTLAEKKRCEEWLDDPHNAYNHFHEDVKHHLLIMHKVIQQDAAYYAYVLKRYFAKLKATAVENPAQSSATQSAKG